MMRSDREELPEGYTKEEADQTEIWEAQLLKQKSMQRGASALAAPTDCRTYWPVLHVQVCGEIRVKYDSLGGSVSFLGPPTANDAANPDNYGRRQTFLNGPIYWSPATGAHPVVNSFLFRWGQNNYEAGKLKYPTTDEIVLPDGGRRQEFQQGAIYVAFQNAVGAAIFNGPLRDKYNSVGGLAPGSSFLGYPTEDQKGLPDGQGQMDRFQNGVIYWSPATGAWPVSGDVLDVWGPEGYEQSGYGYPIADQTAITPNRVGQEFQWSGIGVSTLWSGTLTDANAGKCTAQIKADDVHYSTSRSDLPKAASGHGWWKATAAQCPAGVTANVEVQLQYLDVDGTWFDRPGDTAHNIKINQKRGSGKGTWTDVHSTCMHNGPRTWRILVDVNLNGYLDTPDIGVSEPKELQCS